MRSESKCTAALATLEREGLIGSLASNGTAKAFFHELTLDDPRDAKASAERFLKREKRLDLLSAWISLVLSFLFYLLELGILMGLFCVVNNAGV